MTIPSLLYAPRTISRTIDSFPVDVSKLRVTLTRESWPGTPEDDVVVVTAKWDDGSGGRWTLPGGNVVGRDGQVAAASVLEIDVPIIEIAGLKRKKNVVNGTITVEFVQPIRTAIRLEAL